MVSRSIPSKTYQKLFYTECFCTPHPFSEKEEDEEDDEDGKKRLRQLKIEEPNDMCD